MFARKRLIRSATAALLLTFATSAVLAAAPREKNLAKPPGARMVTLPRAPTDKHQETSVAVNPRDPRNVIVSYHQSTGAGSDHHPGTPATSYVAWSADGGENWALGSGGLTNPNYIRSLDTFAAFDLHGHAFMAFLAIDYLDHGRVRHGLFANRSIDGGRTWQARPITLVEVADSGTHEHMPDFVADNHAASPYAGRLYVVWDRILWDKTFADGTRSEMRLVRSTDDGKSWSKPKTITPQFPGQIKAAAVVGRDGAVYVMFEHSDGDVVLAVSKDGGDTFEAPRRVLRIKSKSQATEGSWPEHFPRGYSWPALSIDSRQSPGRLYIVWKDERYGDMDILASASADGGRTWSEPVRVNDDAQSNGKDQVMNIAAVDPADGALYVLFYDLRNDPNNKQPTVTLARSTDGGRTFANYAWSSKALDPKQASLGDYIGLAAHGGRVYAAWTQNVPTPREKLATDDARWDSIAPVGFSAVQVGIADFRQGAR